MDFVKELKGLSVRLYNTYGIHCDSARLALLAAKELERLTEELRVAKESLERCRAVCNATAEQWRADVAATPAPAEQFRGARRRDAAEATLQRLGYEWHGGELWKPPLGKAPAWAVTPAPAPEADREAALAAGMQMGNSLGVSSLHAIRIIAAYDLGLVPSGAAKPSSNK